MLQQPHGAARLLPAPQPVGCVVGLPGGLRQPVLRAAGEHELDGTPQVDPTAHRNIDGGNSLPRPEDLPYYLPTVYEVRGASLLDSRLLVASYESALGAPYGRNVEEDPEVRGQAHPARMRETLGVQDEGVHLGLDLLERANERRHLPKREEPRYVRKSELRLETPHLEEREPGELEHDDRGIGPVPLRGDIGPRHMPHAGEVEGRPGDDPRRQLFLQAPGLARGEIKAVKLLNLHPTYVNNMYGRAKVRYTAQKRPSRPMESGGGNGSIGRGSV